MQGLRAVAALVVVISHATALWQDKVGAASAYIFDNGRSGVDLFFVISGFIILVAGMSLAGKPGGAIRFLELRLIRLVPIYWLATALKLVLVIAAPATVLVNAKPSAWHAIASFLFIPSANAEGSIVPIVIAGWTLGFEMLFYVLFAIALSVAIDPLVALLPVLGLLSLLSLLRTAGWPDFANLADPLLLEFCFGMIVARLYQTGQLARLPAWSGILLLVAGLAYLVLVPTHDPGTRAFGSFSRAFGWGIAATCALVGALMLERHFVGRLADALVLQGEASYSLYLIHGFVLPAVGFAVMRLHLPSLWLGVVIVVAATAASAVASIIVHLYVERPITDGLRRLAHDRRNKGSLASPASPI